MAKTVFEKYYGKGWLKFGRKFYTAEDRLWAGRFFYADYEKSRNMSEGVRDISKPFVDGGMKTGSVESKLTAKDRFRKACLSMDLKEREMVIKIVIENKEIGSCYANLKEMKKRLCSALDCLAFYYAGKRYEK
ncbi:MAG: hypothetical protein IJ870_02105 [Alphaproteobacteria bacterium]|nr:hypothetical protein [Alphaproteobacteria bacterium]